MKDIKVQNHTVEEVVSMVKTGPVSFTDDESRMRLVRLLSAAASVPELLHQIRVILADLDRKFHGTDAGR